MPTTNPRITFTVSDKTAKMTLDVYARYTEDAGKNDAVKLSNYLKENTNAAN